MKLVRNDGKPIDAVVEIEDNTVILHSRGGATGLRPARNTEYSLAFDLILERLGARKAGIDRVLVDSSDARTLPVAQRIVATKSDFQQLPLKEVKNQIRRKMRALGRAKDAASGQGNSTKRLRFEAAGTNAELRRVLRAVPAPGADRGSSVAVSRPTGSSTGGSAERSRSEGGSATRGVIPPLRLVNGADRTRAAFAHWLDRLRAGSTQVGNAHQLIGEQVRFRPLRHARLLRTEFWVGSSDAAAVQINEPGTAGSEDSGGGLGVDAQGRRYILRQADLHGNNASKRIRDQMFAARTGLISATVFVGDRASTKRWHVVARLDGVVDRVIQEATVEFVERCWTARTSGTKAVADQKRLELLLGQSESGGFFDIEPDPTPRRVLRLQGFVWEELQRTLNDCQITMRKPRHARRYEVDAEIIAPGGAILVEIKTGTKAADIYTGVGQLMVYPVLLPDLAKHERVLLLPGRPCEELAQALSNYQIQLHWYDLKRFQRNARVRFSAAFLRRCGVPETGIARWGVL